MIKLYWLTVNILWKKWSNFYYLCYFQPIPCKSNSYQCFWSVFSLHFWSTSHLLATLKIQLQFIVTFCHRHNCCQNLNFSKLSYLIFSCSSRKKALCNHTVHPFVPLNSWSYCPLQIKFIRDKRFKDNWAQQKLYKKLGKGKLLRVEMWTRANPGQGPWLFVSRALSTACRVRWVTQALARGSHSNNASCQGRGKHHTQGNTRKKEHLAWRKDHRQGCTHKSRGNEVLPGTEQHSNLFSFFSFFSHCFLKNYYKQACKEHQEKQKNRQYGGLYSTFLEAWDSWLLSFLRGFWKCGYMFTCWGLLFKQLQ